MNFSTECLETLFKAQEAMRHVGYISDANMLEDISKDLLRSVKFLLPPPNALNVTVTAPAMEFLRLPYPICAFEYSCPQARDEGIANMPSNKVPTTKSSKRIALAYDCTKDVGPVRMLKKAGLVPVNGTGILVLSLFYVDSVKWWSPSPAAGYVDADVIADTPNEFLIDNTGMSAHIDLAPLFFDTIKQSFGHLSRDLQEQAMLNDVAEEVAMAVRACLMLNAKNLKVVKVAEAPAKLNKKREKNNKPPFFEYRTLDIYVSDTQTRLDRKRIDYGALLKQFSEVKLDRKWGTVKGHFKLRKTGMFWWSDHARGNRQKGVVQKDYRVNVSE